MRAIGQTWLYWVVEADVPTGRNAFGPLTSP
jgi:hypothetical protein